MEYRVLGATGLAVSVLGFGSSPLGGVFGDVDQSECTAAVHEAIDQGINMFDVAPFYGTTRAETVLGVCLDGVPRDSYIMATKVGRYGGSDFDFSAERVTRSVDESLERLRCGYIDLIQAHDIEYGSLQQVAEETIPALRALQQSGKVRFVGISGLPLTIFPTILDGTPLDTILSYCHYTLNDSSLDSITLYLKAREVGIISASPLAMGLLTDSGPPAWHPAPPELKAAAARAAELCRAKGASLSDLALQFALANQNTDVTLVGMANRELLRANLRCVGGAPDPELLSEVLAVLAPVHNLSWPSGRPENDSR